MNQEMLSWAEELVREGGRLLKENFRRLKATQIYQKKGPNDLVTDLDRAVEKFYAIAIRQRFPTHGILGEEGENKRAQSEFHWVIDPLDGTTNYVRGIPFFCTMLSLVQKNMPVMGLIFEPITGDLYTAIKGKGSFCNNEAIQVSSIGVSSEASILYCHGRASDPVASSARRLALLRTEFSNLIRFRSAGCEMAMMASGRAEAYFLDRAPLWDAAAGALLVREAGGKVTTFIGEPWAPPADLGKTDVLASNGTALHERILSVINA
ncbi:inositol monophosphatase [Candidatus Peregrinibacteria bacterium]|nr:inositol monophosphatase [Candidatus Peregrinibacteria bacterium]